MGFKAKKRTGRRAGSFRVCVACRRRIPRTLALRLARVREANDESAVAPDLFGKLPGRGVHLCPALACIHKAMSRQLLSWAFRAPTRPVDAAGLAATFVQAGRAQIKAILATAARAGWLVPGRDAVKTDLRKGSIAMILLAEDASAALVEEMGNAAQRCGVAWRRLLSQEELAHYHSGKPLAVLGVGHRGVAGRLSEEIEKVVALHGSMQSAELKPQSRLTAKCVSGKMPTHCAGS